MEFCYLTLVSFVIYSRDMFRIQALEGVGGEITSHCSEILSGLVGWGELLLWLSLDLSGWVGKLGGGLRIF